MQTEGSCSTSQTSSHLPHTKKQKRSWIRKLKSRFFEQSISPSRREPPCQGIVSSTEEDQEYTDFIRDYPEYRLTHPLDSLRQSDYARLETGGETYVDYMGGALYPESLITKHAEFLKSAVLGNTHSISNSSQASSRHASEARSAVLAFFQAPPEYTVVFTANASAALKLVGEAYPFESGSAFVLGIDSHNSLNGIREYATGSGARCAYIPSTPTGGFDEDIARTIVLENRSTSANSAPCLFALTGQSNISNWKAPLEMTTYASSLGYHVLLDAAALAPTSLLSLSAYPAIDATAVSFYKMFGFPTGIGALIVKRSFLRKLKRPWFSGGTVDIVQVPGMGFTRAENLYEQFEDGTINYTMLPAVTHGLQFLSSYIPYLPLRLSCLLDYLVKSLEQIRHDASDGPVVRILSRRPNTEARIRALGEQSNVGTLVSLVFLDPSGNLLPNIFIEHAASLNCLSLRTGCACNSGAAMAMLGISDAVDGFEQGVTRREMERRLGRETGVVRISLGLVSNFGDVRKVVQFASLISDSKTRESMHAEWNRGLAQLQ